MPTKYLFSGDSLFQIQKINCVCVNTLENGLVMRSQSAPIAESKWQKWNIKFTFSKWFSPFPSFQIGFCFKPYENVNWTNTIDKLVSSQIVARASYKSYR